MQQNRHFHIHLVSQVLQPDKIKQTDAGLRKKRISLLRDMMMHMAPMAIRNRLNSTSMAAATFRSAGVRRNS